MKKIAIYSPFFPATIGGGERVLLTTAEILHHQGYKVDIIVNRATNLPKDKEGFWQEIEKVLHLDLKKLNLIAGPFGKNESFLSRLLMTKQYDRFFYMTDGSFFFSLAKKNIAHFQIPLSRPPRGLLQSLKLKNWQIKTANSLFTKSVIEKNWKIAIDYIQRGCIDEHLFRPAKKRNLILTVGRFISAKNFKNCKQQDFLIKTFLKLTKENKILDWHFNIIGNLEKGEDNRQYFKQIQQLTKNQPSLTIKTNLPFNRLQQDYSEAGIYWHGAGYKIDEKLTPEAVEHFGIVILEAMASGCVPIVPAKGGLREIIDNRHNGFLYHSQSELIASTLKLIHNQALKERMSVLARQKALQFSKQKYQKLVSKIFS